jgi:hypothetical protein
MNPVDLVRSILSPDEHDACLAWGRQIKEVPEQCPFRRHRLFMIWGPTTLFDFPTLPGGSLAYFAANGSSAIRLTRKNKEIQRILAAEWRDLPALDAVCLASLILKFFDAGIKDSHHVLPDADALRTYGMSTAGVPRYELNEGELAKALPNIGSTSSVFEGRSVSIRAVTLCGWMHEKQNLGVESIAIAEDGSVSFAERKVLSRRIFKRVPAIKY